MQKLSVQQLPNIFKDLVKVSYSGAANKLTFTSVDGNVLDVELSPKKNYVLDASYNSTTHKIKIDYLDGTSSNLDLKDLYNIYTGVDNTQVKIEVDANNKIKATIKDATITRAKLASDVTNELDLDRKDIDELKKAFESQTAMSAADMGDTPVLPLLDNVGHTWQRKSVGTADADFKDENPAGYAFTGPEYLTKNRSFNRIKVNVIVPGWIRVGIVRATGPNEYDGVARGFCKAGYTYKTSDVYPVSLIPGGDGSDTTADGKAHTTLKKWLVVQWVASPGIHEFDIPTETLTSPFEYVYCECRTGISGFAMNRSGAAVTVGGVSLPNNTIPNALSWPTTYVTKTNFNSGSYALSNNILDASAQITYSGSTNSGVVNSGWMDLVPNSGANRDFIINQQSYGWLNIGLYERGSAGTVTCAPVIENAITQSAPLQDTLTVTNCSLWVPDYEGQQVLAKKRSRIYAIDLIVTQPGDLSVYLMNSTDPAIAKVLKVWTLRLRAIGRQTVHLPEEVILMEGQYLGIGGLTESTWVQRYEPSAITTSNKFNRGYADTARFAYVNGALNTLYNNFSAFGDDPTGVTNIIPYSGATDSYANTGFGLWSNIKYVGGSKYMDFSSATYSDASNRSNSYLNVGLVVRTNRRTKLEDLNVSITGDSISTYSGTISQTSDFGVEHNAAGSNAIFYPNAASGLVNSPDQTWWGLLIKNNRARLIRNDAWSGSQVGGTDSTTNSTACASIIRTKMLHCEKPTYSPNTTTGLAHPYGYPEVIFCMIGTNDLSGNRAAGAYSNTAPTDISTILGAFQTMVARHRTNYPFAKLVYFMIPRGSTAPYPYTNASGYSISQMAEGMEYVAKAMGAYFVPLSYFESLNLPAETPALVYWTPTGYSHPRAAGSNWGKTDKLHPNILGHQIIANALTRFVESHF